MLSFVLSFIFMLSFDVILFGLVAQFAGMVAQSAGLVAQSVK